jgi:plastocyanin
MRGGLSILIACSTALVLAAGCGSSNSSTTSSSSSSPSTPTSTSGELKTTTTPKFASPSPTAPVQSGVVQVAYRNITIHPDTLKVKVGSTVKWTNYDALEHNVTSESGAQHFASKTFGESGSYEVTLTKPGVIHYECTIHPATMNGTIEVVK